MGAGRCLHRATFSQHSLGTNLIAGAHATPHGLRLGPRLHVACLCNPAGASLFPAASVACHSFLSAYHRSSKQPFINTLPTQQRPARRRWVAASSSPTLNNHPPRPQSAPLPPVSHLFWVNMHARMVLRRRHPLPDAGLGCGPHSQPKPPCPYLKLPPLLRVITVSVTRRVTSLPLPDVSCMRHRGATPYEMSPIHELTHVPYCTALVAHMHAPVVNPRGTHLHARACHPSHRYAPRAPSSQSIHKCMTSMHVPTHGRRKLRSQAPPSTPSAGRCRSCMRACARTHARTPDTAQ